MPRYPVHTLLAEAAYAGREATDEELAELRLSTGDRALVRKAARERATPSWCTPLRSGSRAESLTT